ncbi:MAG: cyclic nucleotide-binding domain-containing protein [Elusimicrobia bacterium]|nr:cyclic nucleotide-binding domain-containing protein [Elusimicrobiota bacterium]
MDYELDIPDIKWAKQFFVEIDFLSQLSEQERNSLIYSTKKIHVVKGKTILFQGEFSNRLFLIKSGKIAVFVVKEGKKTKVAELGEKNYFGEISLVNPVAASATIIAEDISEVFILEREVVEEIFKNKPEALATIRKKIEERKNK